MEIATKENEEIVSKLYGDIIGEIGKPGQPPDSKELTLLYDVEHFQQEIESGASFGQYFNWANKTEVDGIVEKLERLHLTQLANITEEAILLAFPNGILDEPKYFDMAVDWTDEKEEILSNLYMQIASLHGAITNRLGEYAKDNQLVKKKRFFSILNGFSPF